MRKRNGFSTFVIVGIVVAVAGVLIATLAIMNNQPVRHCYVMEPSEESGWISENIKGNPYAPVKVYEYADFACSYCALMNQYVNGAIEVAEGNLAVVYRNYILPYHTNGKTVAAAAQAAGLQGYFKEYGDKLFKVQDDWYYDKGEELNAELDEYFVEVAGEEGDLAKFQADRVSSETMAKVNFDTRLGNNVRVSGTPAFYYEDQLIDFSNKTGGSIKVVGQTLSWDHQLTGEEFAQLLLDIVNIELNANLQEMQGLQETQEAQE